MARAAFKQRGHEIGDLLAEYDIDEERLQVVFDYAIGMLARNPRMNNHRIVRKTVGYFRLKPKPVDDETDQV